MPNLTVTLTDVQWAAYQAVNSNVSLVDATAWLKRQLTEHYVRKLEDVDNRAAVTLEGTARSTRNTKEAAFGA
jgi:hypothetical protein